MACAAYIGRWRHNGLRAFFCISRSVGFRYTDTGRLPRPSTEEKKGIAMSRISEIHAGLPLMLAAPVWAAGQTQPNQEQAVAKVEKLGGRVTIDEKNPDKPVIACQPYGHADYRRRAGRAQGAHAFAAVGPGRHGRHRRRAGPPRDVRAAAEAGRAGHANYRCRLAAPQAFNGLQSLRLPAPRSPTPAWGTSKACRICRN